MKNGLYYLNKLPYAAQVKYLKNLDSSASISSFLQTKYPSFEIFLKSGFVWRHTPEGGQYWSDILSKYRIK
jgi:hypothetical protein